MNKLPTETVVDISSYLTSTDKLNLACACKQLHKAISENSLYNKLVFNNDLKFEKALKSFGRENVIGHQVHHLCLGRIYYDPHFMAKLPTVLPRFKLWSFKVVV